MIMRKEKDGYFWDEDDALIINNTVAGGGKDYQVTGNSGEDFMEEDNEGKITILAMRMLTRRMNS